MSPTYLSLVERNNIAPPTPGRVKVMAELLDADVDEWSALAGCLSEEMEASILASRRLRDLIKAARDLSDVDLLALRLFAEDMRRGK